MAYRAFDVCLDMRTVGEVDEVGKLVDTLPPDRSICQELRTQSCDTGAVDRRDSVAIHADRHRRNSGVSVRLSAEVAILAIDPHLAGVLSV